MLYNNHHLSLQVEFGHFFEFDQSEVFYNIFNILLYPYCDTIFSTRDKAYVVFILAYWSKQQKELGTNY